MSDDPDTNAKLRFVAAWEKAKLYSQVFRSKAQENRRLTRQQFTDWANEQTGALYSPDELFTMIDVYNCYTMLPATGIPALVGRLGWTKAKLLIPWVARFKDERDILNQAFQLAMATGIEKADLRQLKITLLERFPLRDR